MVRECLVQDGEWKRIKGKARRSYMDLTLRAERELFNGEFAGRQKGNLIRSFFIHNGVSMQVSPVW